MKEIAMRDCKNREAAPVLDSRYRDFYRNSLFLTPRPTYYRGCFCGTIDKLEHHGRECRCWLKSAIEKADRYVADKLVKAENVVATFENWEATGEWRKP